MLLLLAEVVRIALRNRSRASSSGILSGTAHSHRPVSLTAWSLRIWVLSTAPSQKMEESRAMMASRRTRFASADELFADLEKNSVQ